MKGPMMIMPIFNRVSRLPNQEYVVGDDNSINKSLSLDGAHATELVRPHTSGSASRRKTESHPASTLWTTSRRRMSVTMSGSATALPLDTRPLSRHHRIKSRSTTMLLSQAKTVGPEAGPAPRNSGPNDLRQRPYTLQVPPHASNVGLALGSPSELVHHEAADDHTAVSRSFALLEPSLQTRAATEPQTVNSRPQVKRWKTVSGLFTRRKTDISVGPMPARVSEDANLSNRIQLNRRGISRSSSYFHRRSKESTPTNSPDLRLSKKGSVLTPTPGEARAIEAGEDLTTPHLKVDIPTSSFDRFSVMFSTVQAPTVGPPLAAGLGKPRVNESHLVESDYNDGEVFLAGGEHSLVTCQQFPRRTQSQLSCNPPARTSLLATSRFALPVREPPGIEEPRTPLVRTSWLVRPGANGFEILQESESLPDSVEAWALGLSPADPVLQIHQHRFSNGSCTTSVAPSPSLSCSSWYMSHDMDDIPTPVFKNFPIPPSLVPYNTAGSQLFLAVPSPSKRTSWDNSSPSPEHAPSSSSSPRLKFGYDAPHSPLVSVATTVTVSIKGGQAQKAQIVVREEEHSRQASCSGTIN